MHTLFQLTLYTGQQLVLEGLHRWLQRPCQEVEQQRQRRTSLKSLIVLLLKTAATGVLATVLDAAIEYRRRQVLAAAARAGNSHEADVSSRFSSFGMLSRAGISAWKTRLLVCIDELERQAERYGIEAKHRFSEAKPIDSVQEDGKPSRFSRSGSVLLMSNEEDQQRVLAKTVEQLRSLVKEGGEDADEALEKEVDSLLDTLLGGCKQFATHDSPCSGTSSSSSIAPVVGKGDCSHPGASADTVGGASSDCLCQICMDRNVRVQVEGCKHELCFQCARRLCANQDHQVPQCPFCRQNIDGFASP